MTLKKSMRALDPFRLLGLFMVVLGLSACTTVSSPTPVGRTPLKLNPVEWEGEWFVASDDEPQAMDVVASDPLQGEILISYREEDETKRMKTWIKTAGDWTFASVRADESEGEAEKTRYVWGRLVKYPYHILVWTPKPEAFAKLVGEGKVRGITEESESVALETLTESELDLIMDQGATLFDWDKPLLIVKKKMFTGLGEERRAEAP